MSEDQCGIAPDAILIANPTFVLREEGDEGGILYNPDTGGVQLLNSTAVALFKQVNGKQTLPEVIRGVKAEFSDVDPDADSQLEKIARRLLAMGAIGVFVDRP